MKSKLIEESPKTFVLVFETGDEAMNGLLAFAKKNGISAARFTGIGAFEKATLGYFDWQKKDYRKISVDEQVEVLNITGDVAVENNQPKIHAHIVLGRDDGSTRGGHLLQGHVRPTLEVVLVESPARLQKQMDAESGLALIRL